MLDKLLFYLSYFYTAEKTPLQKGSIKFSALVTGIKGLVGGSVFSSVKNGAVIQNRAASSGIKPPSNSTNPKHQATALTRKWPGKMAGTSPGFVQPDGSQIAIAKTLLSSQNISTISKSWQSLLSSDHAAWDAIAKTTAAKNKFGDPYTPSAFQYYMQTNLARLTVGLAPLARPRCNFVKVIDDEAQETMLCLICDGESQWCIYLDDLIAGNGSNANERMQIQVNGNPNAFILIYLSPPMSSGRSKASYMRIIGIVNPVADYQNFILRLAVNQQFGSNIGGHNFAFKAVALSPGGSQTIINQGTFYLPKAIPTAKIKYTLKTTFFVWLGSDTDLNFGETAHPAGTVVQTILIYGIEMSPSTLYEIELTQGVENNFSIVYGDPAEPINLNDNLTDIYGNILPIPLQITFNPQTAGIKDAIIDVRCGTENLEFTISGTGT